MRNRKVLGTSLTINIEIVNKDHADVSKIDSFSFGDSTYRFDGFSIGQDYLRLEGRTISRGELIPTSIVMQELIGQGAFSKVHKGLWNRKQNENGRDECFPTAVAIKSLCLHGTSEQRRSMLRKELRTLCRISSESLVKLEGAFLHEDTVTMVMEYMDNGSLEQLIHRRVSPGKPLDDKISVSVAFQVLWGLAYLHHEHIIHRDIKPGNILLHSDGSVKLCDFGLVSLSGKALQTTVVGTSRYMAPERLRAKPYGRKSDIWSLGLVLLECFTGEIPWSDSDSLVSLVVTVEETPLASLVPETLPLDVQEVLSACLQQVPEKRIPSDLLMKSPWFHDTHRISSLSEAKEILRSSC